MKHPSVKRLLLTFTEFFLILSTVASAQDWG